MTLWYIDEDKDDLFTYKRQLQNITQNKIIINAVEPSANCAEMVQLILADSQTVAVVIDYRLGDASNGVCYNGLDLAKEIRKLNSKMPLYILTNNSPDLSPDEWEIEYVLSKDDFISKKLTIAGRINRHINIFFDLLTDSEKRFSELLKKSISETLTADELQEFEGLDYFRSAPLLEKEAAETARLQKKLNEQEELLNKIKVKLEGANA